MPTRGYLICSLQRTGSTLLANALIAASAGRPKEYFNPKFQDTPLMHKILGESRMIDGFDKILVAGTSLNGLFGVRVHGDAFRHLGLAAAGQWIDTRRTEYYDILHEKRPELLSVNASLELLRYRFANETWQDDALALLRSRLRDLRFVRLGRRNMIARAISEFRARKTDRWYLPKAKAGGAIVVEPEFDFAEIHIRHCLGVFQEEQWQRFFDERHIAFKGIFYEDLVTQYDATVRSVLAFLRADDARTPVAAPVSAKQSNELSIEWEARYRRLSAEAGLT